MLFFTKKMSSFITQAEIPLFMVQQEMRKISVHFFYTLLHKKRLLLLVAIPLLKVILLKPAVNEWYDSGIIIVE